MTHIFLIWWILLDDGVVIAVFDYMYDVFRIGLASEPVTGNIIVVAVGPECERAHEWTERTWWCARGIRICWGCSSGPKKWNDRPTDRASDCEQHYARIKFQFQCHLLYHPLKNVCVCVCDVFARTHNLQFYTLDNQIYSAHNNNYVCESVSAMAPCPLRLCVVYSRTLANHNEKKI